MDPRARNIRSTAAPQRVREEAPKVLLLLAPLLVAGSAVPTTILANGGTLRLTAMLGPYEVSVFTDPTPVRPDSLDVSVLVRRPGDAQPLRGLRVFVRAEAMDHVAMPLEHEATREAADDPRYYAAKFPLVASGRWRITVSVAGEEGSGEGSFEVNAVEQSLLGQPRIIIPLALLPLVFVAWWLYRGGPGGESPGSGPSPPGQPGESDS